MADIFQQSDARRLLRDKYMIFLGDSNCRALYKDLLWLLNSNSLIESHVLKRKLEFNYLGDELVERSDLMKGRDFKEVRLFKKFDTKISFHFLTRCYNDDLEKLIKSFKTERPPDVIFMSSCLWDISRWGPQGVSSYKDNVVKVMKLFNACLPASTLVIWGTALPISSKIRSGFLIKQIEFLKHMLRFEVMEANTFARQVVVNYGYDVLDLHYHMRMQIHRRAGDGVHYKNLPVRLMTNLLLTHIALAWDESLPGKISNSLLEKSVNNFQGEKLERLDSKIPLVLKELNLVADTVYPEHGDYSVQQNKPSNNRNKRRWRKKKVALQMDGIEGEGGGSLENDGNTCTNNNNNKKLKRKKKKKFVNRVNPY